MLLKLLGGVGYAVSPAPHAFWRPRSVPYYCALQKRETGIVHLPTAAKLSLACVRDRSLLDQWSAHIVTRHAYGYLHFELDDCNYSRFYAQGIFDDECSEDVHLFLVQPDTRLWCNNTKGPAIVEPRYFRYAHEATALH